MKAITEAYLRAVFRQKAFTRFDLAEGQLLTPSAAQFLRENRVEIGRKSSAGEASPVDLEQLGEELKGGKGYVSVVDGTVYERKPEHMTHLHGNLLVNKSHPRISLRGELDNFQSAVLLIQAEAAVAGQDGLVEDLTDILQRARAILKAEVVEQPLEDVEILGLDRAGLREHSHHPRKYYHIGHITPDYQMGRLLLAVNELRSKVRKVELSAVRAFCDECSVGRPDLIEALNAMSSALYIIMLRQKSAWYTTKNSEAKAR